MTACEVIVMKEKSFESSRVFIGSEQSSSVAPQAEEYFRELVRSLADYDVQDEEMDYALEDGIFVVGNDRFEVIITWPCVVHVQ